MQKSLSWDVRWHRANGHTPQAIRYHVQTIQAFLTFLQEHGYPTGIENLHVDYGRE